MTKMEDTLCTENGTDSNDYSNRLADLVPPESSLVMVVPYDCHYTDDDEIDTNQVVEYLGKNHNNETEYKAGYPHP